MNLREFYKAFRQSLRTGKYTRVPGKNIRFQYTSDIVCPITVVCMETKERLFYVTDVDYAGKELGLSQPMIDIIVGVSDSSYRYSAHQNVRKNLLRITREEATPHVN